MIDIITIIIALLKGIFVGALVFVLTSWISYAIGYGVTKGFLEAKDNHNARR